MRIKHTISPLIPAFIGAALLTACSTQQPEPAPEPVKPRVEAPPPAPPQLSDDWTEWDITPGQWIYRQDDRGSIALFGEAGTDATLTVRCDTGDRKVYISRAGSASGTTRMTLRASSGLESYNAASAGGTSPYVAAAITPTDIMLDRITYTRGRFAVEVTGQRGLAIPIWSEFTRVVEDCRS